MDVGNVSAVLDGDLDPFIKGVLLARSTAKASRSAAPA
jgi:hypothetical protein